MELNIQHSHGTHRPTSKALKLCSLCHHSIVQIQAHYTCPFRSALAALKGEDWFQDPLANIQGLEYALALIYICELLITYSQYLIVLYGIDTPQCTPVRKTNARPLASARAFRAGWVKNWPGWVEFYIESSSPCISVMLIGELWQKNILFCSCANAVKWPTPTYQMIITWTYLSQIKTYFY